MECKRREGSSRKNEPDEPSHGMLEIHSSPRATVNLLIWLLCR